MRKIIALLLLIGIYSLLMSNQVNASSCTIFGAVQGKCTWSACGGNGCKVTQRYVTIVDNGNDCCAWSTSGCEDFTTCVAPTNTPRPTATKTPTPTPTSAAGATSTPNPIPPTPGPGGSCPWSTAIDKSTLPGSGVIQAHSFFLIGNNLTLMEYVWRGDYGYYRTIPVAAGEPQWSYATGWSQPVSPSNLPGSGTIQTQSDFLYSNNTKLMEAVWRNYEGYYRIVSVINGVPQWDSFGGWSGPISVSTLPGSGTIQTQSDIIISNGTKLMQSFWRGDYGYWRIVPVVSGEPQWGSAGAWSSAISVSTLPGSGTIQTYTDVLIGNGAKLMQYFWRGDWGYQRTVPVVSGEPQWSCDGAPTATPAVGTPVPTSTPIPGCTKKSQGDANCDGTIDGIDYSYWLNRQCTTGCSGTNLQADFNGDGRVDDGDYKIWFDNSR